MKLGVFQLAASPSPGQVASARQLLSESERML